MVGTRRGWSGLDTPVRFGYDRRMWHRKGEFVCGLAIAMLVLGAACSQDPPAACAGACSPGAPEGWEGPRAFWRGELLKSGNAGPCTAKDWSFAEIGYPAQLEAEPVACKPCACEPGEGASAGTCVAREVEVELEAHLPDFTRPAVIMCTAEKGGVCGSGSASGVCLPPPSKYEKLCVYKRGDVPCEGAWAEGQRFTYYAGFDDSRDCTPCACEVAKPDAGAKACGAPSGGQSIGAVSMRDLTTVCCR